MAARRTFERLLLAGDLEEAETLNRASREKAIESGDEPLEKMLGRRRAGTDPGPAR